LGGNSFIFDGFPRTTVQARKLDEMLAKEGVDIDTMISLTVSDDVVVERILKRGAESGRTDDQSVEIIQNRLATYNRQTAIVEEHYKERSKHRYVKGVDTVEETFGCIVEEIEALKNS